jgi:hypothetical protein
MSILITTGVILVLITWLVLYIANQSKKARDMEKWIWI